VLGGGVDTATLVAALGAGPPPPECRWGRRPHRGETACRLLERDDLFTGGCGAQRRWGAGARGGCFNILSNMLLLIFSFVFTRNTQHPHTYTTILIYESTRTTDQACLLSSQVAAPKRLLGMVSVVFTGGIT